MTKYDGLLEQFGRYHREFTLAGLKPSRDDIEEFMEKFFTRTAFHMGATSWDASTKPFKGASSRHRVTREVLYVIDPKKTTKENIDEIRPILHEVFLNAHGSFGIPTDNFDPKPIVPVTDEQKLMHEHMKDFAYRYNQLTLPFRLRKTMHHELQAVTFRGGEIATSKRFTLRGGNQNHRRTSVQQHWEGRARWVESWSP